MAAAQRGHNNIIEILLLNNANPSITNNFGSNALHFAACYQTTTTTTVQLLLNNMKLEDINHKNLAGNTPLDCCYYLKGSSIKEDLIALISRKGGKRGIDLQMQKKSPNLKLYEMDICGVEKLNKYEAPTLKKAVARSYTFIYNEYQFKIKYCPKKQEATVTEIKSSDDQSLKIKKIIGKHFRTEIIIKFVYMDNAKGKGFCTQAVAYLLKVLLDEAAKKNEFPYEGKVYIESKNPCAAVNCYSHAFMINGFLPDKDEMERFIKTSHEWEKNMKKFPLLKFVFTRFISKSQLEKFKQQTSKKRKKVKNTSEIGDIKF